MMNTQEPLTVPSSGGVDSVCYSNQGNWFIKKSRAWFLLIIALFFWGDKSVETTTFILFYFFLSLCVHPTGMTHSCWVPQYRSWFPRMRKNWSAALTITHNLQANFSFTLQDVTTPEITILWPDIVKTLRLFDNIPVIWNQCAVNNTYMDLGNRKELQMSTYLPFFFITFRGKMKWKM